MREPGPLVVDASVGVKFLLEEEDTAAADAVIDLMDGSESRVLLVPDHFFAECANALRRAVLRGRLEPEDATREMDFLVRLNLEGEPVRTLAADALAIVLESGISLYDALYVALSDRTGAPLVTADRPLFERLAGTRHRAVWLGDFTAG